VGMPGPHGAECKSSSNLADEVRMLLTMLTHDEDFIQGVNVQLRRSPSIILYSNDQINDIRTLCSFDRN